jgi:hypothetical protein
MHDIPENQIQGARPVALDLAALVLRAAAVGLSVALVLAGATLLVSTQTEVHAGAVGSGSHASPKLYSPRHGELT